MTPTALRAFFGRPRGRRDHLDALDGLRGLAVLIVLASHLSNAGMSPVPGLSLAGTGKSGVYLFFVLSAFLLTRLLLDRPLADLREPRLWADYAMRRVLRIWPLYLVLLLASWAITHWALVDGWHYRIDTPALWRHLALQEGQSVLWSIPVEFTFYLWLPPIAVVLAWAGARRPRVWMELPVLAAVIAVVLWAWPPSRTLPNDVRLGPYLLLFLLGAYAARIDILLRASRAPVPVWTWGIAGAAVLASLVATIPGVWAAATDTALQSRLNHHWFLYFGLAWAGLVLAVLHGPAWLRGPFAAWPMRLVGIVSFSAYLWHMPVLAALSRAGIRDWPAPAAWVLAAVMLASMASYLLFERPWRDIRLARPAPARDAGQRTA